MAEVTSIPEHAPTALTIIKNPHGGWIVGEGACEPGMYRATLRATSTIDEALAWMRWALTGEFPGP